MECCVMVTFCVCDAFENRRKNQPRKYLRCGNSLANTQLCDAFEKRPPGAPTVPKPPEKPAEDPTRSQRRQATGRDGRLESPIIPQ